MNFAEETAVKQWFYGWAKHFQSIDRSLTYTKVETAHVRQIADDILLAGVVDAEGDDFFSEHKSSSPRDAKTWKQQWLLSPQALTYGLLTGGHKKFLVRKVFKKATPEYDHEWFTFSPSDLTMWERQVRGIALGISDRAASPWLMNIGHGCFAYGPSYPCPMWADGCTKHNFDGPIPGSVPFEFFPEFRGANRELLLKAVDNFGRAPIVLSATRIDTFMRCPELYRRLQTMSFPPSVAMEQGTLLHSLLAEYYRPKGAINETNS